MSRAKQPVSLNGIEFDALMNEDRALESTIPEYSIEKGFVVSDAIIKKPEKISMTLYLTATPVTWRSRHGAGQARVDTIVKELEELYFSGEPVTLTTSNAAYTSMGIESIGFSKSPEIGYALEIPITFKKIRITEAKTTTIPNSYGKSGKTGASAGSANTTAASMEGSAAGSGSAALGESGATGNSAQGVDKSISANLFDKAKSLFE